MRNLILNCFSLILSCFICLLRLISADILKEGLCAPPHKLFITGDIQKCSNDLDCPYDLKCCESKSRIKVCSPPQPAFTACQHQKTAVVEIARSIDGAAGFQPECDERTGGFTPIQCSENKNRCWCVDEAGFEIPGTRAALGTPINCSAPRACPHPECRMLCPQSFQMDKDGCPVCSCYDACEDIKCPRSTRCITEDVRCVTDPCPPISKCAARAVDDVDCPNGLPALVDSNRKDYFLCSLLDTIKTSKCPAGFDCHVRPNKEFGVCCPQTPQNILKPGQCPPLQRANDNSCVVECQVDQDCYDDAKCCSDNCTSLCLAPLTITPCQAQRRGSEKVPGVFVPHCDPNGQYAGVQCFGSKCWCVDAVTGVEKFGTRRLDGSRPNCSAPTSCGEMKCDLQCSHGYQFDADGCPICACHLPCEEMGCPNGCNLLELDCGEASCPTIATCKEGRNIDHPCIYGSPARDNRTQDYMICGDTADATQCPDHTKCEPMDAEGHGVCCPLPGTPSKPAKTTNHELQLTKPVDHLGKCPAVTSNPNGPQQCGNVCSKDRECSDTEKCCESACGLTCMAAITKTACQVHAELFGKLAATSPRLPVPRCDAKGSYEEQQCFNGLCWCVDNLGREQPGTRTKEGRPLDCAKPRECNPQCRIFCPYDLALDEETGCPVCDCANPCGNINCPTGSECKLVTTTCAKDPCPNLPQCAEKKVSNASIATNPCSFGSALEDERTRSLIMCGPKSAQPNCPVTHECVLDPAQSEHGVCCQRETVDVCSFPKDSGPCRAAFPRWYYDNKLGECKEFLYGGCEGNVNNFHSKELCDSLCKGPVVKKPGHCPVPAMDGRGSCQQECESDGDCPGLSKCCSNGCGRTCTEGAYQTVCDQQKSLYTRMSQFAKPDSVGRLFIPQCLPGGAFEPQQCDNRKEMCWCVDDRGQEIDGTRRKFAENVTCAMLDEHACDQTLMCRMDCPFGFVRNATDGCPECECEDKCDMYECPPLHECKVMELPSLHGIVSRVPVCAPLPTPVQTCPFGEPLRSANSNQPRECVSDSACPSAYTCSKATGNRAGVCCSKESTVCLLPLETGPCRGTIPRWGYDPVQRACKTFLYGGCQSNGNNFATTEECEKICSVGTTDTVTDSPTATGHTKKQLSHTHAPAEERMDTDFCLVGKPLAPTAVSLSDSSTELCGGNAGCPLSHVCTNHSGTTMCCPKTSDECFLPVVRGTCTSSILRYYFDQKSKNCLQFTYSGCDANGNNFASETQCRDLCPVMSTCENERLTAVERQTVSRVPVFIPDCDEYDGSWLPVQCQPALGLCWCVDHDGKADMSTAVRGYPDCNRNVIASNVSAEICSENEPVQFCDPQMCHHQICLGNPKAQCKVSPCGACRIDFYGGNNEKVDCFEGLTECQKDFLSAMYSPNFAKLKIPPPLMAPGTKSSADGSKIVHIVPPGNVTSDKAGFCPPYFAMPHEGCAIECHGDSQCQGDAKCCFAGCGYTCVPAIPVATTKPGQCPFQHAGDVVGLSPASPQDVRTCTKACVSDLECPGNSKCCSQNSCDLVCTEPVVEHVLMPVYLPTCNIKGDYEWTQCSGEVCWCVDEKGSVKPETVVRGQIQCNSNGIIAGAHRPLCPAGQPPKVCQDACRNATCPNRPDAFCAADPCNECAVTFVDSVGKSVDCQDTCSQKVQTGSCNGSLERFHFNMFTQECHSFNYSGCDGNDNNFVNLDECRERCLPEDICMQDMSVGPCRALIDRWFYNKNTHQCEQFGYGGCHGNGNNFHTKEACESRCPQLLVCPKLSSGVGVKTCNRTGLCENAKCAHPLAQCRVNPCTCQAEFVDKWGRELRCDALPTKCQHESMERSVMADIYHPQCHDNGKYRPLQCFADHFSEKCWCVDESGNALDESKFSRGERDCAPVEIAAVRVLMRFAPNVDKPEMTEEFIKATMTQMLNDLSHQNIVDNMLLTTAQHHIALSMLLRGDRSADVAYFFSKMLNRSTSAADLQLLQFHTEFEYTNRNDLVPNRALLPIHQPDGSTNVPVVQAHDPDLLPLLALLVLAVILAALIGIFMYRRRRTGSYTNEQTISEPIVKTLPNDYVTHSTVTSGRSLDHIYELPKSNNLDIAKSNS
ncbi:uncharacterized protein LOC129584903 [Paramacrobiotus metropolitanus]|uniref:uncharacterized protein LOC129584903 n=1 Tax=Paramacrobiotus metropolitanus TaxID=2943436 RepID=UPI002445E2F9|nr:uncharacterized protein LOC129584903 [Paramacrobiotus metropolitanus]XP_055333297.1 uncharacterized protein LOC129584903 [Paramacrobiotus metropolitanus]XP_055333298.1 uncharacterized protein LOC129584903 [Paramacrobiotus metropolitanus]